MPSTVARSADGERYARVRKKFLGNEAMSRRRTLPSQDTCWYVAYQGSVEGMYRPDVLLRKSQKDKPAILEEKRHHSIHDRMANPPRRQVDFATSSDSNITGFLGRHNFARNRFLQLPTLLRRIYASWTSSFFSQIEDDTNVHKSTCPRLQLYFRSTRRRIPVSRQNLRSRKFRRLDRFEEAVPPLPAEGSL
jgi:hypothetical protein